jgi:hypothetical protein
MSERTCRPCAEARGATFRPNAKADFGETLSIGNQCKFCKSTMHVVFPVVCWEWPENKYFDARAQSVKTN